MDEAAALPSPRVLLSRRLKRYYGRLRHPPGTLPASRLTTGYRTRTSGRTRSIGPPGRGGSPQFPPPPSERSEPSYAGRFLGAAIQDLHPFHGLRRDERGSAPPLPHPHGQASLRRGRLRLMLRTAQSLPQRALDAALRPRAFPPEAGSLLPGLLTATRAGLAPAGDDELMLDQLLNKHLQLWAHLALDEKEASCGAGSRCRFRIEAISGRRCAKSHRATGQS